MGLPAPGHANATSPQSGPITSMPIRTRPNDRNETARRYFEHSSANRINTDAVIVESLRKEYPELHLTVVPQGSCNILGYASAGNAGVAPIDNAKERLSWRSYIPPASRLNGSGGLGDRVMFGKYLIDWKSREFVLYLSDGRDGSSAYPQVVNQYVLSSSVDATNRLLMEAGQWSAQLHDEVWVFDGGNWQKSSELWKSVHKASWDDVM